MSVIALAQNKGGTGKTTSCINLGVALAELGKRVLLIDFDPQCNLSLALGLDLPSLTPTMHHVFGSPPLPLSQVLVETPYRVTVAPADMDLAADELLWAGQMNREYLLAEALKPIRSKFDFIFIDCPPSLGLLTVNALVASDHVIIPLQCAWLAMKGMQRVFDLIDLVKKRPNRKLKLCGILLTMFDPRTLHAREVQDGMCAEFGDQVFRTVIKRTVRFDDATVAGEPLLSFSPHSPQAEAYRQLAQEVLQRV